MVNCFGCDGYPALYGGTLLLTKQTGEWKLSREELQALDKWLVKTLVPGTYPLEASAKDETFIINAKKLRLEPTAST